jgi:hypothetical protein
MKNHVETLINSFQWTTYRTSGFASGKESEVMTRQAALAIIIVPFIINIGCIINMLISYEDRLFQLDRYNILLQIGFIFSLILFVKSMSMFISLTNYTKRELYVIPRPFHSTPFFEKALLHFYLSVAPGNVRQPKKSSS